MNDLVSIIIPIYNSEKYLNRCLDSIVNQSYPNLEIILLNDGSSDGSGDICEFYADNDSRVMYISKENEGQSVTRNRGIEMATGRYLYFMDSDDYVDSGFIENALSAMSIHKADCAIFNYYHIYSEKEVVKERDFLEGLYNLENVTDRYVFLVKIFLSYKCGYEVWNRLYDANIIRDFNLRFPVFKPVVGEDLCFNLLYFLCANRIHVSNDRYYYYVHNDGSTMDLNKGDVQIDRINNISKIVYDFISEKHALKYIKDNYAFLHILLIYRKLMYYSSREAGNALKHIKEKNYFREALKTTPTSVIEAIKALGVMRGIKYMICGFYYQILIGRGN